MNSTVKITTPVNQPHYDTNVMSKLNCKDPKKTREHLIPMSQRWRSANARSYIAYTTTTRNSATSNSVSARPTRRRFAALDETWPRLTTGRLPPPLPVGVPAISLVKRRVLPTPEEQSVSLPLTRRVLVLSVGRLVLLHRRRLARAFPLEC